MAIKVWTDPFNREIIDELKIEAAKLFRIRQLPESASEWEKKRAEARAALIEKLAIEIDHGLDLDVRYGTTVDCGAYSVTPLCYRSTPERYVTASLYRPAGEGPFPAVVRMHGHNRDGRLSPGNQERAAALALAGYVVLFIDAFGSGERSSVHGEFEYHGGLLGGALFNIGKPLLGIQVTDNMRGCDFLCSLPFVDAGRIGATGESGGGNQTMYLAAFDERIKAAAPVVSVGSYQSYVGGTNCVCELIPDGLEICEESTLLALAAPRALKLCNALHDINHTFYVSEMMRSFSEAMKVFTALGVPENLSSMAFNAGHSYPVEVQSAVIGFFDFYLKGKGHGMPAPVPAAKPLPLEKIMLFQKGERAKEVCSIIEYIGRRAQSLAERACGTRAELAEVLRISGGETIARSVYLSEADGWEKHTVWTSRGRLLPFLFKRGASGSNICRILAAPGGKDELGERGLFEEAERSPDAVLVFDPWGCGECGYIEEIQKVLIEQHQLSRSLIWLGRRLMGEWTLDFLRAAEFVSEKLPGAELVLRGVRDSGVAALFAAILADGGRGCRVREVEMINSPATFVRRHRHASEKFPNIPGFQYVPPEPLTMALCIPGILEWGDVPYAVSLAEHTGRCKVVRTRPCEMNGAPAEN